MMKRRLGVRVEKYEDNGIVGANFIVEENEPHTNDILLIERVSYENLKQRIEKMTDEYVKREDILDMLDEIRDNYCPISHTDSSGKYGKGSVDKYGHVKLISTLEQYNKYKTSEDSEDYAVSAELLDLILKNL